MIKTDVQGLLVDDDPFQRRIFCDLLEELGCKMSAVSSAEAALDIPNMGQFDFFLFDMVLPGMSGLELGEYLTSKLANSCPPIILMSATPQGREGQIVKDGNRFSILIKPFTGEQFMAVAVALNILSSGTFSSGVESSEFDLFDSEKIGLMSRDLEKKRRYAQLFVDDIKQCRLRITQAIEPVASSGSIDIELLSRSVHSLKGLASHLSDKRLAAIAVEIEDCIQNDCTEVFRKIDDSFILLDELLTRMARI